MCCGELSTSEVFPMHASPLKAAALVPLTAWYRTAFKAPLFLLRGKPELALAELTAAMEGMAAALRALPTRWLKKIPPGAEI